jgi:predicted DNA-binding transcriptional regulator AlpA
MTEDPLVTAAEVARLAGVGRAAVSNWRRRYADFPQAAEGTAASPRFDLADIRRWLREQGKDVRLDGHEQLWRALRSADESEALDLLTQAARYLRQPSGSPPAPLRAALSALAGPTPAELVDELCEQFFSVQQRQHLTTPPELAALMATLAGPLGTVFDPACGPGALLRAATQQGATSVSGQEINTGLAGLAQERLALSGTAQVAPGDSLRLDAFPDLRADTVLCHPPFAQRDWGYEQLGIDPRWEYGLPPKGESELAWLQHCLAHAAPGATVVLLLTSGVAHRRSGRAIRQALLRKGALRAVVGLPSGVLMTTGAPLHLWVLRAPPAVGNDAVLLVDLADYEPPRRGRVNWDSLCAAVLEPWRLLAEHGSVPDIAGRQRIAEPIELLDEDVDFTPARHLPMPAPEIDPRSVNDLRDRIAEVLGTAADLLPYAVPGGRREQPTATIGELARAGALALHQQPMGRTELDEHGDGPLVLTGRDVASGQEPTLRLADDPHVPPVPLRPGDIVVPSLAAGDGRPRPTVVTAPGPVLGPNLQLIRVDPARLDADFLAGHLGSAPAARASGSTVSGVHRLDVRRVEIPVLDLARQRELGTRFRRLRELRTHLSTLSRLGADLAEALTDGLAAGVLDCVPETEPDRGTD